MLDADSTARVDLDTLSYRDVAKTIDHSLLRPELDLNTVADGVLLAIRYDVMSATVRPADVAFAGELVSRLRGPDQYGHRLSSRQLQARDEALRG